MKLYAGRTSMRGRFLVFFVMAVFFSCQKHGTEPAGSYDSMVLQRSGGGDLAFNITPLAGPESYQIVVTHREFRDTTIQMVVVRSDAYARTFEALTVALNGQAPITGDFKEGTLPMGSWVRVYMVKGDRRDEVTNTQLRDLLLPFEPLVRSYL